MFFKDDSNILKQQNKLNKDPESEMELQTQSYTD